MMLRSYMLLRELFERADEEGRCDPSVPELSAALKACDRTVQLALRELEGLGWIATKLRPLRFKVNDTNVYTILPGGRSADLPRGLRQPRNPNKRGLRSTKGETPPTAPSLSSGPAAGSHAPGDLGGSGVGSDPDEALPPGLDNPSAEQPPGESYEEGGVGSDPGETPTHNEVNPEREETLPEGATSTGPSTRSGGDLPESGTLKIAENLGQSARGGTPEGGAAAPSEIARARMGTMSCLNVPEQIRHALTINCMADLTGGGFERRLDTLCRQRGIHPKDWIAMLAKVGTRRAKILFDADGKTTKWSGPPEAVRGMVYIAMRREPELEEMPNPKAFREPSLWQSTFSPRPRVRVEAPPVRDHAEEVQDTPANACAKRILEALGAEYHGVRSLGDIADMDDVIRYANALSRASESAACGGKLTEEDLLATIEQFATFEAFRVKRGELQAPSLSLRNFLTAQIRKAKRGCAESLREKTASAKFFDPTKAKKTTKIDTRQPGEDLSHLRKPKAELTQEEAMAFLNSLR